jgi:hypothetical protein
VCSRAMSCPLELAHWAGWLGADVLSLWGDNLGLHGNGVVSWHFIFGRLFASDMSFTSDRYR